MAIYIPEINLPEHGVVLMAVDAEGRFYNVERAAKCAMTLNKDVKAISVDDNHGPLIDLNEVKDGVTVFEGWNADTRVITEDYIEELTPVIP